MLNMRVAQQGSVVLQVGVAVLLIIFFVVAGYSYYVNNTKSVRSELPPGIDLFTPISAMPEEPRQLWSGTLRCDALRSASPFERPRELIVVGGVLAYERGETDKFLVSTQGGDVIPGRLDASFEWWRGVIDRNKVELTGWYTEGGHSLKVVSMQGEIVNETLKLEGRRGPRHCYLVATLNQPE